MASANSQILNTPLSQLAGKAGTSPAAMGGGPGMTAECPDPEKIKDIMDIDLYYPLKLPDWFWWVLLLLFLAAAAAFIYFKYIRQEEEQLTVFQRTIRDLNKLNVFEDSKLFYLRFSDLLKRYFEDSFELELLEKTNEEMFPVLQSLDVIETKQVVSIKACLERSSLAKFAKQEVDSDQKSMDVNNMISLITEIEKAVELKKIEEIAKQELDNEDEEELEEEQEEAVS